jgi:CRP/FNR family cyclic AMP-dependent transcriptional regulator
VAEAHFTRGHADPAVNRIAMSVAFSTFPEDAAAALRATAVHRCWSNGSVVLAKGRIVPWVMSILRGRLRIAASVEVQEVFVRWQMPGETVGLVSAVSDLPLPVDVIAFDDCETLHVDREVLLQLMRSDANVACAAARHVAVHAYDLVHHLAARTEQTLTARVLGVLRHLAVLNGSPAGASAWTLAVSQQEIASAAGASRQRVNVELRTLERAGLIKLGYRHVVVYGTTDTWIGSDHRP